MFLVSSTTSRRRIPYCEEIQPENETDNNNEIGHPGCTSMRNKLNKITLCNTIYSLLTTISDVDMTYDTDDEDSRTELDSRLCCK